MIAKFHKRDTVEKVMFGWVHALRVTVTSCTVEQAIDSFLKFNSVDEKEFNKSSLRTTYNRMVKEYYDEQKIKSDVGN